MDFIFEFLGDLLFEWMIGATPEKSSKKRFWIQGFVRTIILLGMTGILILSAFLTQSIWIKVLLVLLALAFIILFAHLTRKSIKNYRKTW